jgi:hypothetical protein
MYYKGKSHRSDIAVYLLHFVSAVVWVGALAFRAGDLWRTHQYRLDSIETQLTGVERQLKEFAKRNPGLPEVHPSN